MTSKIWAHRGSSLKYIENSLAAFDHAAKIGADGIEIDVQRTKDNELVVVHDENLKRLTGEDAFVWELTLEELQSLTLSTDTVSLITDDFFYNRIPTLYDVLNLYKDNTLTVNIELKNSIYLYKDIEEQVVEAVNLCGMQDRVLYSSFNHQSMHRLTRLVSRDHIALLTSDIQHHPVHYVQSVGAGVYHPMINALQVKNIVDTFHQQDMAVNVWTVDDEPLVYLGLLQKADALITNDPEKVMAIRQQFIEDGGIKAIETIQKFRLEVGDNHGE